MNAALKDQFGNIDIYLFDQLLKGRFDHCKTILDLGCGSGRNLVYFLQHDFEVYGIDQDYSAIQAVNMLAENLGADKEKFHFSIGKAEELPFPSDFFELVISSAVFHFAKNLFHFDSMLRSAWRVLKPGGYLFARVASDIGIEDRIKLISDGRFLLPDGSERFLVNEKMLLDYSAQLGGILYEPIKTTNVQNLRCMTTWCLQKKDRS